MDFLALSDHHDAQVYKPTGARKEKNCSGAIGINVIGASDRGPVAYRAAIENDGVNLGQRATAVKVSHVHATDWDGNAGCGEDQTFHGESVIAP